MFCLKHPHVCVCVCFAVCVCVFIFIFSELSITFSRCVCVCVLMCSHVSSCYYVSLCMCPYTQATICVSSSVLVSYTDYERVLKCMSSYAGYYKHVAQIYVSSDTGKSGDICYQTSIYVLRHRLLPVCAHVCSHTQAKVVISDLVLGRPTAKANRKLAAISGRLKREF